MSQGELLHSLVSLLMGGNQQLNPWIFNEIIASRWNWQADFKTVYLSGIKSLMAGMINNNLTH